ncbi:hypothetical protein D3C73_1095620 [compost metagenome]
MVVLVGRHDAAAHAAGFVQRRGQVQRAAIGVPIAGADADVGLEFTAGGVFAHQVDGRRRIARAGQQAGGPPHNFHAVIDDGVEGRLAARIARVEVGGDAVVQVIGNGETARTERIALTVVVLYGYARRAGHDVGQRQHVFVFHALASHHRDRLRRFTQRQRQARAGGRGARRVGPRPFGRGRVALAHHLDGGQGCHGAVLRGCTGGRQRHQHQDSGSAPREAGLINRMNTGFAALRPGFLHAGFLSLAGLLMWERSVMRLILITICCCRYTTQVFVAEPPAWFS